MIEPAPAARARVSGVSQILGATVIAGVAAYVVTWLVPHQIGLANYALFAVFWSFLYLVVGTLSGIQQEVTRGTRVRSGPRSRRVARASGFAIAAASAVIVGVWATAPFWVGATFSHVGNHGGSHGGTLLVWPLAVGTASYVLVAVFCGSLYGTARWRALAVMIGGDALLRLLLIAVTLSFTTNVVALAWATVIPFPLTLLIVGLWMRRSLVGNSQLDVGYRALSWNVARTMLAAAATGAMVSGFPLLLGLTAATERPATVGLYILAITLTRAPLIVVAMSLQSYFVVAFKSPGATFWRNFLRLQALILGSGIVLALAGWWLAPAIFAFLFNGAQVQGWFIAVLVLSSALVGSLCISAPAVLARGQHFVYAAGWLVAAVITIVALLLPLEFTARTLVALIVGPIAGLLIHGTYLARSVSTLSRNQA